MDSLVELSEQKKAGDSLIVIFDGILIGGAIVITWFILSIFQKEINSVSLRESRFLTIEWNLLQEYKQQVDNMLHSKDREIAELKERYQQLESEGYSKEFLQEIDTLLNQLEAERENILAARISGPVDTQTVQELQSKTEVPPASTSIQLPQSEVKTLDLLSERIEALEKEVNFLQEELEKKETLLQKEQAYTVELEQRLTGISELENQINLLKTEKESLSALLAASSSAPPIPNKEQPSLLEPPAPLQPHDTTVSPVNEQKIRGLYLSETIEQIEKRLKELQEEPSPSMETIQTRALLRAIVSTPLIRSTYPDLLKSVDKAFEEYGRYEYTKGEREAYLSFLAFLRSLEASAP